MYNGLFFTSSNISEIYLPIMPKKKIITPEKKVKRVTNVVQPLGILSNKKNIVIKALYFD